MQCLPNGKAGTKTDEKLLILKLKGGPTTIGYK
jgi:hypothetical protein